MPTISEILQEELPKILPEDPEKASTGTQLMKKLKKVDDLKEVNEDTLRQYISLMAQDATSCIAKRAGKHGYYLRETEKTGEPKTGKDTQREEKFRSIFMKYSEFFESQYPMKIEHTKGQKTVKGLNKWKYPDVVLLKWDAGIEKGSDNKFVLDHKLLEVRKSLGEQSFKLSSIELKTQIEASNLREYFFQCVSNSKWAHSAKLVIATKVSDVQVVEELARLGKSYDINIISYSIDLDFLDELPDAQQILKMSQTEFEEKINNGIDIKPIATAEDRDSLDWEHLSDLQKQNSDFMELIEWISECISDKKPYKIEGFLEKKKLEGRIVEIKNTGTLI